MKTQTAMVARNYRLQQWAEMVRDVITGQPTCRLLNGAKTILLPEPITTIV